MAFRNSILAGETIVRKGMQSEGFETGVSGWRLSRDGNAEFNNVTIRTTLESDNYVAGQSGWQLNEDGTADLQNATLRGTWRVADAFTGGAFVEGGVFGDIPYIKYATDDGAGDTAHSWLINAFSSADMFIAAEPNDDFPQLHFLATDGGAPILVSKAGGGRSVIFDTDGYLRAGSYFPLDIEDWEALSSASGTSTVQAKLLPTGICIFRGSITGHSTTNNVTLMTLPAKFRPIDDIRVIVAPASSTGNDTNTIRIDNDGTVQLVDGLQSSTFFSQVWFPTV